MGIYFQLSSQELHVELIKPGKRLYIQVSSKFTSISTASMVCRIHRQITQNYANYDKFPTEN
jgi:hypothetical protein